MRSTIGVIAVIALVAGTLAGAASTQGGADATLIANERALLDAVGNADTERFRTLVLPAGIWATPSGFVPMDRLAGGLGVLALPQWGLENPRIVWTEGNSALLLYVRTGGGRFGDRPLPAMTLASTLWTKRDGKWVAVYHQESEHVP